MYFESYYFSLIHLIALRNILLPPGISGGFKEKEAQVANLLVHPVYITELQTNLRAWGMKIVGSKKDAV